MKKRFLLFIIFSLFVVTSIILLLVLYYIDPYKNEALAISLLSFSFLFAFSSFFTLIIYFFKKILMRGDVYIYHVISSFRQWLFITFLIGWYLVFDVVGVLNYLTFSLLFLIMLFLELFIQNISRKSLK